MKVLIPADVLKEQSTGVETYTLQLISGLAERANVDLTVVARSKALRLIGVEEGKGFECTTNVPFRELKTFDIVHFPTVRFRISALLNPVPRKIVTIHDLVPLIKPRHHSIGYFAYFRFVLPLLLRRLDHVVAPSDSTRRDVVRLLGFPESRISVVPLGSRFSRGAGDVLEREPLVLSVGTLEPRKNTRTTIEAFLRFKRSNPGSPHKLICIGRRGWERDVSYLADHADEAIEWRGWVDDRELEDLYSRAQLLVYPSLYEGFGLPVLEAMTFGCPVITSNRSSLPEVGGDAAIYVDPMDVDSIAKEISNIVLNRTAWTRLSRLSLEQAERFSWNRCIHETLAVYESVQTPPKSEIRR